MSLGLLSAQIAFKLQPRWPHVFWQMSLQHFCTSLLLCGHRNHHDKQTQPKPYVRYVMIVECSGSIFVATKVALLSLAGAYVAFCSDLQLCGHSGHHNQNI